MKNIGFLIIGIMLLTSISVKAQKNIDNQHNIWLMYVGNHTLNDKWELHTLYHFRRNLDENFDWQQSLLRAGLNYKLDKNLILSGGADWVVSFPYGEQPAKYTNNEFTGWQAAIVKNNIGRLNLMHRYRFEERFIQKKTLNIAGDYIDNGIKYANRFRYWLNITVPLNHSTMTDKTWFVNGWDEIFVDIEPGPIYNLLNQNRIGANVGYQWHKGLNLQLGYMNQLLVKSDVLHAESNHTLMIQFQKDLNLSSTK